MDLFLLAYWLKDERIWYFKDSDSVRLRPSAGTEVA